MSAKTRICDCRIFGTLPHFPHILAKCAYRIFFSPLGKLAGRAIYFTDVLARSAKWPTGLYVLPSVISVFFFFFYLSFFKWFLGDKLSQDPLNRFSQSLRRMKAFWCRWSIWTSFFDIPRDVAMATEFVQKWGKIAYPPALIALAFRNGMG